MTFPALSPRHLDWSTNPVTADSGATLIAEMVTHLTTAATTHSGISRLDSSTAGTSARVDCASVSDSEDTAMTMDTTARDAKKQFLVLLFCLVERRVTQQCRNTCVYVVSCVLIDIPYHA